MPINYYICINVDPAVDAQLHSSSSFIDVFSILLHILIKIRIAFYKSNKQALCCFQNQVIRLC